MAVEMQGGVEGTRDGRRGGEIGGGIPTGVSLGVWSICLLRTRRTMDGKCWGCHGKDVKRGSVRMLRFQAGIAFIQDSEYIGKGRIFGFNCDFDVTCVGGVRIWRTVVLSAPFPRLPPFPAWLPGIRHVLTRPPHSIRELLSYYARAATPEMTWSCLLTSECNTDC
jgi:hypothetical protein